MARKLFVVDDDLIFAKLLAANLLHSSTANWNAAAPTNGTEIFTYKGSPQGTVHGTIQGNPSCVFN